VSVVARRQNRRLLFRTYLVIVGGLVAVAIAFDFGFGRLQDSVETEASRWMRGNLALIEAWLLEVPPEKRPSAAAEFEHTLGYPVRLLPADHVVHAGTADELREVFDADGRPVFFLASEPLGAVLQVGPVPTPASANNALLRLVPPLFYLSIFVVVGLWIRPLLRDLGILTESAQAFAADYRHPIRALEKTSSLTDLAATLDEMSSRIRNLIQGQKELTGGLSHELRTPLTRIKFALAVIGKRADIADELHSIGQDVQEIDVLITTMLDYARLDHPDTRINRQLTPVDAWLDQVAAKCRGQNAAISIEHHAPAVAVTMDPYLMELALSNLLVNACRYASSRVLVRVALDDGRCCLSVDDDGCGIPPADRRAVFKAFARLDNSRNRQTGGYGLGLAIVARIAVLHGGFARAEDSALGGARLVVCWDGGEPKRAAA
jgi:signal transduction histidine kinase